ncbi:hypothetical protein BD560DRAFT_434713 [Blakeslea trispora]|nr:hypothetical protein BD560DRAFT_434713 [Blakeslea trispora]
MSTTTTTTTISEIMYRLKARLAFANFKREHGYEQYDLYTLESNLLLRKQKTNKKKKPYHRYYPTKHIKPTYPRRQTSTSISRYPLSAKRTTSPYNSHLTVVPPLDDENTAAHVLVMLHQHALDVK